jgi:hypothetical protein
MTSEAADRRRRRLRPRRTEEATPTNQARELLLTNREWPRPPLPARIGLSLSPTPADPDADLRPPSGFGATHAATGKRGHACLAAALSSLSNLPPHSAGG